MFQSKPALSAWIWRCRANVRMSTHDPSRIFGQAQVSALQWMNQHKQSLICDQCLPSWRGWVSRRHHRWYLNWLLISHSADYPKQRGVFCYLLRQMKRSLQLQPCCILLKSQAYALYKCLRQIWEHQAIQNRSIRKWKHAHRCLTLLCELRQERLAW